MLFFAVLWNIIFAWDEQSSYAYKEEHFYNKENQQIVEEREGCQEAALLHSGGEAQNQYIIAYCKDEPDWRAYDVNSGAWKNIAELPQDDFLLAPFQKKRAVLYLKEDEPRLYVFDDHRDSEYSDFVAGGREFLLRSKDKFYLVYPDEENSYDSERLDWKDEIVETFSEIENFWLVDNGRLIVLSQKKSSGYLIYNVAREKWLIAPRPVLSEKEKDKLNNNNVLLRLTLPPGEKRSYFKISVDGNSLGRTEIVQDGAENLYALKLSPGVHVIKPERFSADTRENDAHFSRVRNLEQAEAFQFTVVDEEKIIIELRAGLTGAKKPVQLRAISLSDD